MPSKRPSYRYLMWLILALALTGRLGLWAVGPAVDVKRAYEPDTGRYVLLAENLLRYHTFGKAQEDGLVHNAVETIRAERGELEAADKNSLRPELFRTPGYPLLIAGVLGLGMSLGAVLVLQCLLSTVTVAMVMDLGRRWISPGAGLVAGVILALHPVEIVAPNTLLSETFFVLLMTAGLWLAWGSKGLFSAPWRGIGVGLSALARPIGVALGPLTAVAWWLEQPNRKRAAVAVILAGMSGVPIGLWACRNAWVSPSLGPTVSTVSTINAWYYTVAHMRLNREGKDWLNDWPAMVRELSEELARNARPGEETFATMRRLAGDEVRQNPELYLRTLARSEGKLLLDHSMGELCRRLGMEYQPTNLRQTLLATDKPWSDKIRQVLAQPAWKMTAGAMGWTLLNAILTLLAVWGLVRLARARRWAVLVLLAGGVFYFAVATQTVGLERFRLPMAGMMALLAGTALAGVSKASEATRTAPRGQDTPLPTTSARKAA
ncbi:MAG: glycosyltransferase family 39 protein [Phycisphaeraceae bacterium]|nr:glycosyltransferase family 39 protein [Phycisphaeraceae bacterium]